MKEKRGEKRVKKPKRRNILLNVKRKENAEVNGL